MNTRALTERQIKRRQRILQTARDQLSDSGYEGLNMRDLAAVADVSPTTLYNLFGNKDILVLSALRDMLDPLWDQTNASGERGLARIVHHASVFGQQIIDAPRYAEAMALMMFNATPEDPITQLLVRDNLQNNLHVIEEMQALRELRHDIDVELIARNLTTCGWSVILLWMKRIIPLSEFKKEYVRASIAVLAPAMTPQALKQYRSLLWPDLDGAAGCG
ncbi:MAG: TetR/AcrR family transcriptional regulator [Kiritimatiellia bacterium]|jgi:AcrR family transcriptional regulator|nr:TetR/AcrR family transcriptional regulator [Pseudomonadales bacterium]MDP6469403.1 TetR/AcrR family transcriptional regulator [Pseudomonadales bacterium]MDP6828978.1 TetR/AcrR family transcriptional regulator [Pseudomonadales bacterium]MDP7024684.1 TetR/AcrR family transcriptional regulator [Kiritimatiellia bacterium]|tara:strand:+ start:369 stop:1025 length:657 start_codon:yes stop_codon:yes gene_type:complete